MSEQDRQSTFDIVMNAACRHHLDRVPALDLTESECMRRIDASVHDMELATSVLMARDDVFVSHKTRLHMPATSVNNALAYMPHPNEDNVLTLGVRFVWLPTQDELNTIRAMAGQHLMAGDTDTVDVALDMALTDLDTFGLRAAGAVTGVAPYAHPRLP